MSLISVFSTDSGRSFSEREVSRPPSRLRLLAGDRSAAASGDGLLPAERRRVTDNRVVLVSSDIRELCLVTRLCFIEETRSSSLSTTAGEEG